MRGKKNDFSITYYFETKRVLFLQYVHDTNFATRWVNKNGIEWTHYVIYNRRTRERLDVIFNVKYPVYSMLFYSGNALIYKMRNVWNYTDAVSYVRSLGIRFEYVNIYDFLNRNFIERLYF